MCTEYITVYVILPSDNVRKLELLLVTYPQPMVS